jgi:hypothetical protein
MKLNGKQVAALAGPLGGSVGALVMMSAGIATAVLGAVTHNWVAFIGGVGMLMLGLVVLITQGTVFVATGYSIYNGEDNV